MKKLIIICMGVFLVMWGLSADVMASGKNHGKKVKIGDILRSNVKAQDDQDSEDDIEIGMQVDKIESSSDEFYDIQFYLEGDTLKDAKKVQIKIPTGKKIELKNTVGLNSLVLETNDNSTDGFELVKLLTADATSFSIPEGLLQSDTEYELDVMAYKAFDENAYLTSVRYINFKTETLLETLLLQ